MELNIGTRLHGFTVRSIRDVPGTSAQLVEMLYEDTATPLVWYKSQEPNKLFNVIFKTLPQDSTGVFHILEHSLLCGSEKYPVKEPFVELMKSSMNTFLNAITFPDKTMYPVSSRNEQDYLNLTAVYLDAAFAPRAMCDERIFLQEGWHHEIEGDSLRYNGVVFNEMKGAMSAVDEVVYEGMQELLFPDTSYGFNSGGDPKAIPDLTYEQFCRSYREHYHPSNALIYLDGSVPLEKTLEMASAYLSRFSRSSPKQESYQHPGTAEATIPCEAAPGEDTESKCQLVLGKLLGTWQDKDTQLAAQVLCDVLCGSNDAPLKRAFLSAGLAQDVSMQVVDGIAQPFVMLRLHNMKDADTPRIRELLRDTLAHLTREGLDKDSLTAAINHLAFQVKDIRDPQSLFRCLNVLNSWLYGGDPMLYLTFDQSIAALREMALEGGFETLMGKLLDDENLNVLHVVPSQTYGSESREAEANRLAREREALDDGALAALEARNEAFHRWQQTPDAPESLELLPVLNLEEIPAEPLLTDSRVDTAAGIPLFRHAIDTNGIVHLSAYFDLTDLSREELTGAKFLTSLLGKLPTARYDAAGIHNAIRTWLGELDFSVEILGAPDSRDLCRPCLAARCSVLEENLPQAEALLAEILTATQVNHPERIREILLQTRTEAQQMAVMAGHSLGMLCAQSHFSARNAAVEAVRGYSPLAWLRDFAEDFDGKIQGFIALSQSILRNLCTARLTLSVTSGNPVSLDALAAAFPRGEAAPEAAAYESPLPRHMGIRIPAQVSYACTGYRLDCCGESYRGSALLVSNILSLSCLWNSIRVQGGAYGAGMNCDRFGNIFCYSYRDPSPGRSLDVYRSMESFIRDFRNSGESLNKYIISTIASTEPLMKPVRQGMEADRLLLCGITPEEIRRERLALLNATQEELLTWCPMFNAMASDAAICVVGHEAALADCAKENLTIYSL